MAQNSWPFHNGTTGTPVLEDQWSIMARSWATSGVLEYANNLEVYGDSSGRQVKVKTGRATVRGHWYESTAVETLAIAANSSGNPRIDRVVLRLDPSANTIALAVLTGTAAGSPSAPALTQTDVGVYEITLARVAVANGASTITAGNVTDERTFTDGVWQSWTPTLTASVTNPTGWTCTGRYVRVGKLVTARFKLVRGTDSGSGTYYVSLPAPAAADQFGYSLGRLWIALTGGFVDGRLAVHVQSTTTMVFPSTIDGPLSVLGSLWFASPGDAFTGQITYEIA